MSIEVQDVFAAYFDAYAVSHSLTPVQWKAVRAIMNCRTAALGAHIDACDQYGYTANMWNPPDVLLQWLSAFPIADSNCSLTRVTSMGSQPAQIERCTMGRLAG